MKISEAISQLQSIHDKRGDIELYTWGGDQWENTMSLFPIVAIEEIQTYNYQQGRDVHAVNLEWDNSLDPFHY